MRKQYWLASVISFLGLCCLSPNASAQDHPAGQDEIKPPIASVAELLRLHERQREAHLKKDAEMLVAMFADDFVSISAGKIERLSKAESRRRFQAYFDRSTFLAWDDISPPIIRVSRDDRMAYVIVHKRVRLKANDEKAGLQEETTIFAWLETYEKQHGRWALKSLASTNQPPVR